MAEAAAMPETLFTVWINLFERGFAAEGDTVLVHGGTSGIGTMAIKLGTLFGLEVIVTCGSDEKCAAAIELGAAHAINYTGRRISSTRSGAGPRAGRRGGARYGRRRLCPEEPGLPGRRRPPRLDRVPARGDGGNPDPDIMRRRLTLTGSTLRARDIAFKTMVRDEIAQTVWPYVEGNRLKPVMDQSFPLEEAAAAHARMEAGDHIGKIVLTTGSMSGASSSTKMRGRGTATRSG